MIKCSDEDIEVLSQLIQENKYLKEKNEIYEALLYNMGFDEDQLKKAVDFMKHQQHCMVPPNQQHYM